MTVRHGHHPSNVDDDYRNYRRWQMISSTLRPHEPAGSAPLSAMSVPRHVLQRARVELKKAETERQATFEATVRP